MSNFVIKMLADWSAKLGRAFIGYLYRLLKVHISLRRLQEFQQMQSP
jgi:hypothetical protein